MSLRNAFLAFGLCVTGASCGNPTGNPGVDAATSTCAGETRALTYQAGMQQSSTAKHFQVKLVSSTPGPPIKGNNDWLIAVTDEAGNPVDGATVTCTPFMPDHGHGTPIQVGVTPKSGGQYQLSPVNLFMSGLWQVTINVDANGTSDQVMFSFCVEG
jgi:nitrogen fixation protein FixH